MSIIVKAARWAAELHSGQTRKYNDSPYIWHPMRVAGRAMLLDCGEAAICAAWLHDTIEDCGITADDIAKKFHCGGQASLPGVQIATLVQELTNPSKAELAKLAPGISMPRWIRTQMNREHIVKAGYMAQVIKLLDRIDNLNEMQGCDFGFWQVYQQESKLLGEAILNANEFNRSDKIVTDLVAELEISIIHGNLAA